MHQLSFDDSRDYEYINQQPERTAFIDECGNFGFDFSLSGTSKFFVLCAIIINNSDLESFHEEIKKVCHTCFGESEMKSSKIGDNHKRRKIVLSALSPIKYRIIALVANKEEFTSDSPLTNYKDSFIKFLNQRLYMLLYHTYPKLKIIEDNIGNRTFQESFKDYVAKNRPEYSLINSYDFDFIDSKDSLLIQLADIIAGTIYKAYSNIEECYNFLEIIKGKIIRIEEFPYKNKPYFASLNPADCKYDQDIYSLSVKCANDFIKKHENDDSFDIKLQIATLEYLLMQVHYYNASSYISSGKLLSMLKEYSTEKISRNFIFRRIIAPLRDAGVILASCNFGYKIPINFDDILSYLNQTHTIVSPMLNRMGICRKLILQQSNNSLDILNDPAFLKYKTFFD